MALIRFCAVASLAVLAAFPGPAWAQSLPSVTVSSASHEVTFDRDALEAMGLVSIKTATPWSNGVVDFEGVPLKLLLEKADAVGTVATVVALNDYSVDIPITDFETYGTILAVKRDGEYMPVADQGPFFVVYPFDSDPALQGQPYYGRAVWQVKEISVQ